MTTEKIAEHLERILPEFLDGFALIGFSASNGEPIVRCLCPNEAAQYQMNAISLALLQAGGWPMAPKEPEQAEPRWTTN